MYAFWIKVIHILFSHLQLDPNFVSIIFLTTNIIIDVILEYFHIRCQWNPYTTLFLDHAIHYKDECNTGAQYRYKLHSTHVMFLFGSKNLVWLALHQSKVTWKLSGKSCWTVLGGNVLVFAVMRLTGLECFSFTTSVGVSHCGNHIWQ